MVRSVVCHCLSRLAVWIAVALMAAAAWSPARAQNEALQFILEQARQRQARPVRPPVQPRVRAPRFNEMPRRAAPSPVLVVQDEAGKVKVEPTIFITVFGDSMGELLGTGLEEAMASAPDVQVTRRTRPESGLVRADFFDWPKSIRDYLSTQPKISFAVMQLGLNDRQAIRDEAGQSHEAGSEKWRALYGERVETVARLFAERQVPLLWIGLPPMPYANYSAAVKEINEITRQHVEAAGGKYIDIWDSFSDSEGRYAPVGPDINGQNARLRAADGVHLSKSGARKAAHFADIELKRLFGNRAPAEVIAVPAETVTKPEPVAAPAPQPGAIERAIDSMVAGRTEAATQILIPVKPVAGPIVPLNQPPLAKDGLLITRAKSDALSIMNGSTFDHGRLQIPKPGRADDFPWPPR